MLVLSQYVEPTYALRLLEGFPGGMGYLLKERVFDGAVLYDTLRRLADGECVVDPTIVARFMSRRRNTDPIETLSARERDVLSLIAQGRSNAGIAKELFISERTVESHATQIFTKLGIAASIDDHRSRARGARPIALDWLKSRQGFPPEPRRPVTRSPRFDVCRGRDPRPRSAP